MTPQKQLYRHQPELGTIGDCERTCLACLLDLTPDQVPHFGEKNWEDSTAFNKQEDEWLQSAGYRRIQLAYDISLESLLKSQKNLAPHVYYILSGQSKTGCNHSVIGLNDQIVWDPSINDSGIVGPCDDGYYWITYLISEIFIAKEEFK